MSEHDYKYILSKFEVLYEEANNNKTPAGNRGGFLVDEHLLVVLRLI